MNTTRREFMRQVGVTLAGLLLSGCDLGSWLRRSSNPTPPAPAPTPTPSTPTPPQPTPYPPTCYIAPAPTFFQPGDNERWRTLRACWLDLKDPRLQSLKDTDFSQSLRRRHAEALAALISNQEMEPDIADEIRTAFEQAVAHVQRQMATCYIGIPAEYEPRQNLTMQAATLAEMAQRCKIDPDTAARAKTALERDMAWLSRFQAGQDPGQLTNIQVTPAEVEAARILVELLLVEPLTVV